MKIENDTELKAAIAKLEEMGDREGFSENEELFKEFEELSEAIKAYEDLHYPIPEGSPEEIAKLR